MLKYNILFLAGAAMLFTACKNEKPAAPVVETPKLDLALVEKTSTEGAASLTQMQQLLQELNTLPPAVKAKQADAINNMVEELNGMVEKESAMVADLKSMTQAAATETTDSGADPAYQIKTLQEYSNDMNRYHERVKQIQSEVKTMKE